MENDVRQRLLVALDVDTLAAARILVEDLQDLAGGFKVGMQLYYREGPAAVSRLVEAGAGVFLDLKLHDIPNTVAAAARALWQPGVKLINFHAAGGRAMLEAGARAVRETAAAAGLQAPLTLGVTVLTSLDAAALRQEWGLMASPREQVVHWARLCQEAGLDGVVASPQEIEAVKNACGPAFLVVTPGVRPAGVERGDQARVLTPGEAVRLGADYLVVGRPITAAPEPRQAVVDILSEMRESVRTSSS